MKEIKIGDTTYNLCGNALSYILFKNTFNKGIYEDINLIRNYMLKQLVLVKKYQVEGKTTSEAIDLMSDEMIKDLSDFIESITRVTYILIKTGNKSFMSYEEWLTTFNPVLQDDWIAEVAEYTAECFR